MVYDLGCSPYVPQHKYQQSLPLKSRLTIIWADGGEGACSHSLPPDSVGHPFMYRMPVIEEVEIA